MTAPAASRAVLEERAGLPVLRWPGLDALGVQAVVTTRDGGVSTGPYASLNLGLHVGDDPDAAVVNRRRAAAAVGLDLDELVFCAQSHGREVVTVTAADRGRGTRNLDDAVPKADALVTREADLGLVVMVADCVPIVLLDPRQGVLATVHAGWRGTVAGVTSAAIGAMVALGSDPTEVYAAIGPAVPAARYEVGDEVAASARAAFGPAADEVVTPRPGGRWSFDLWAANRLQLAASGIQAAKVFSGERPTGDGTPFFSDRALRPCGRFAAIARLTG